MVGISSGAMPSWEPVSSDGGTPIPFPSVQIIPLYSSGAGSIGGDPPLDLVVHKGMSDETVDCDGAGDSRLTIGGTSFLLCRRRADRSLRELHLYLPLYI